MSKLNKQNIQQSFFTILTELLERVYLEYESKRCSRHEELIEYE